jgi:hypothetical protein
MTGCRPRAGCHLPEVAEVQVLESICESTDCSVGLRALRLDDFAALELTASPYAYPP